METTDELLKVSELELIYKSKVKPSQRLSVKLSKDAEQIFRDNWDKDKMEMCEEAKMILLNRAGKVLGLSHLSTGGICGTIVDPRLIFATALKANATSIILAHCHPSGHLQPSQQDEIMTQRIKEAGRFLEIRLLDHLILTSESFLSMADEGIL
jgi:DNA repair protein RadC